MVVLGNAGIWDGGPYSKKSAHRGIKLVGRNYKFSMAMWRVKPSRGGARQGRNFVRPMQAPFLPVNTLDPFHFGGNSVCYAIQWAHLMGADPIYLLGFTLQAGSPYEWGSKNPITKVPSCYETDRALMWLRWYESRYPGRVRVFPGWEGPIYDVFQEVAPDRSQTCAWAP